jgi:hypothetical protein
MKSVFLAFVWLTGMEAISAQSGRSIGQILVDFAEIEVEFKFLNDSNDCNAVTVSIHSRRCKREELCPFGVYGLREMNAVQIALLEDTGSPEAHITIAIKD